MKLNPTQWNSSQDTIELMNKAIIIVVVTIKHIHEIKLLIYYACPKSRQSIRQTPSPIYLGPLSELTLVAIERPLFDLTPRIELFPNVLTVFDLDCSVWRAFICSALVIGGKSSSVSRMDVVCCTSGSGRVIGSVSRVLIVVVVVRGGLFRTYFVVLRPEFADHKSHSRWRNIPVSVNKGSAKDLEDLALVSSKREILTGFAQKSSTP